MVKGMIDVWCEVYSDSVLYYQLHVSKRTLRTKVWRSQVTRLWLRKTSSRRISETWAQTTKSSKSKAHICLSDTSTKRSPVIGYSMKHDMFVRGLDYPKIMMAAIRKKQWEEECALITK